MATFITPDRIHVLDGEHTVFDTDERLFLITNFVTGSIGLPARTASYNGVPNPPTVVNVDVNANTTLASIHASANVVLGSFFVTTSGGSQGVASIGWFSASGTYVHYYDGWASSDGDSLNDKRVATNRAFYTFIASGGTLILNERVHLVADQVGLGSTITLLARTFQYKLFCGTFI